MWYDKQKLDWNIMPDDWMIRRLMLPEGQLDMVLDTDTYNEVDDQFALTAYFPERSMLNHLRRAVLQQKLQRRRGRYGEELR